LVATITSAAVYDIHSKSTHRMTGLCLTDLVVVPMDGPETSPLGTVRSASIRVQGDRIAAVGDLSPDPGEPIIDCSGLVAVPGFVQGHVHFCQTLFRGLADDLPLMDWLSTRIWPLEAAHDARSTEASARLSILELMLGGTTTAQVMESTRHTEASFEAAAESGMTAIIGNCLMDLDQGEGKLATTREEALHLSDELRRNYHGRGRLSYAVSPRFILSCSDGLSRDAAAFATEHDLRIHTHACEHAEEVDLARQHTGSDYILALRDQGLLGARSGLAHCVHTSDAERRALVETGAAVLHCPTTNLKLGSGMAPIEEYRALGLRVALGADGAPCNNRLSALGELRQAALIQATRRAPGAWPAEQALFAATRGGAQALGLENELGSLEVGKRADIVLLDLRELEPGGDPVSRLTYSAGDQHVRHVVLGGEVVVRDGEHTRWDAAEIRAHAVDARDAVVRRAGLGA